MHRSCILSHSLAPRRWRDQMRANLVSPSSAHLSYAIRDIVKFGEVVRQHGVDISWENIGDPIAKGEKVVPWITGHRPRGRRARRLLGLLPHGGLRSKRVRRWPTHVNARAGARVTAERHHLLQRRRRRGGQGLRLPQPACPHHRPLPGVQHPFVGGVGPLRPAAPHLRLRSRQRLAARSGRPAPQDPEEPDHRRHPDHQSQQPHRRRLPGRRCWRRSSPSRGSSTCSSSPTRSTSTWSFRESTPCTSRRSPPTCRPSSCAASPRSCPGRARAAAGSRCSTGPTTRTSRPTSTRCSRPSGWRSAPRAGRSWWCRGSSATPATRNT